MNTTYRIRQVEPWLQVVKIVETSVPALLYKLRAQTWVKRVRYDRSRREVLVVLALPTIANPLSAVDAVCKGLNQ